MQQSILVMLMIAPVVGTVVAGAVVTVSAAVSAGKSE